MGGCRRLGFFVCGWVVCCVGFFFLFTVPFALNPLEMVTQRTRLEDVYSGERCCPAAAVRGMERFGGTTAGLWEPPGAPGFPFAAAQVIHSETPPGAKFIIFPRIMKGGEEGGVVRAEQVTARAGSRAGWGTAPVPALPVLCPPNSFGGEKELNINCLIY